MYSSDPEHADADSAAVTARVGESPAGVHLVSFDIPFPANYGGVMVVYHRLRALHAAGVRVVLHCFEYGGRRPRPELEPYCAEVHYYPRPRSWTAQLSAEPFIIRTRRHPALLRRLAADDWPILFEGLHTTAYLAHPALAARTRIVLMHNVEWKYYAALARLTTHPAKKLYFTLESWRLRRVERRVTRRASAIVALTPADAAYFRRSQALTLYLPPFHGYERVESQPGLGAYALFHGKLSVPDNARAAQWLVTEVFSRLPEVPFVIAGLEPPPALRRLARRFTNVELIANADQERMDALVREAQVHVLVSFQSAGIKLKLLHALFRGRFCVTNTAMVEGTDLAELCLVHDTAQELRETVAALMHRPFTHAELAQREARLGVEYSDRQNAERLLGLIRRCVEHGGPPGDR